MFQYSQEDHTPAGAMADQIPGKIKKNRYHRAMALQQKVSRAIHERYVGQTLRVLVEQPGVARSHADAPDIDGTVRFIGPAKVGEFCEVKITGAAEYDLQGVVAGR